MADTDATARCRSCRGDDLHIFLSLGKLPLPDALRRAEDLDEPEARYPLDVAFCGGCTLVQLVGDVSAEEMFVDNYLYFSSFSDVLLTHSRVHAESLIASRDLDGDSLVVELASNDGYLLRNFVDHGVPVLGVDPAPDQAKAARAIGVPTLTEFFGVDLARRLRAEGRRADVIIANNVMAHVPDLDDFVGGMAELIADDGLITIENPYVRDLIEHVEFDTIYHEHVCYYSCTAVDALVRRHGLFLNHVQYFPNLHGGTLRWHVGPREQVSETARRYLADEAQRGMTRLGYYEGFAGEVERLRSELRALLAQRLEQGRRIAGYGAAAKGTILLNYVGIDEQILDFVVDRNPHKHGRFMPGVDLEILPPEALLERAPDDVLLLAWNFTDEIVAQQADFRAAGGQFIRPVPTPQVIA